MEDECAAMNRCLTRCAFLRTRYLFLISLFFFIFFVGFFFGYLYPEIREHAWQQTTCTIQDATPILGSCCYQPSNDCYQISGCTCVSATRYDCAYCQVSVVRVPDGGQSLVPGTVVVPTIPGPRALEQIAENCTKFQRMIGRPADCWYNPMGTYVANQGEITFDIPNYSKLAITLTILFGALTLVPFIIVMLRVCFHTNDYVRNHHRGVSPSTAENASRTPASSSTGAGKTEGAKTEDGKKDDGAAAKKPAAKQPAVSGGDKSWVAVGEVTLEALKDDEEEGEDVVGDLGEAKKNERRRRKRRDTGPARPGETPPPARAVTPTKPAAIVTTPAAPAEAKPSTAATTTATPGKEQPSTAAPSTPVVVPPTPTAKASPAPHHHHHARAGGLAVPGEDDESSDIVSSVESPQDSPRAGAKPAAAAATPVATPAAKPAAVSVGVSTPSAPTPPPVLSSPVHAHAHPGHHHIHHHKPAAKPGDESSDIASYTTYSDDEKK